MKRTIKQRFLNKVNKTDSCWLWIGWKNNEGYGYFSINGKKFRAHRVSYKLFKNEIPKGLLVCHSCDNPSCVNPEHLWLGTDADNAKDRDKKGRGKVGIGERQACSKLTKEQVLEIRSKYIPIKYPQYKLAKEYGISQNSIKCIIKRMTWKHI